MLPKQLRFLHPYLHFTGLLLMVAGLPFSLLLMSLSQFFIGGNWILEGEYAEKWARFKSNRSAWLLCALFLMLLPGMLWTENLNDGFKLIRINLPFLIYPFVLASVPPLKKSWYELLLKLSLLAVFLATLACTFIGLPRWLNGELSDIRNISLFISHIRFALLIALAILIGMWMLSSKAIALSKPERGFLLVMILWMTAFLFILQSLTGLGILLTIALGWGIYTVWKKYSLRTALLIYAIPVIVVAGITWQGISAWKNYKTPDAIYASPAPDTTIRGNPYTHALTVLENGHYVLSYVCEQELRQEWKKRSTLNLDSTDKKGHSAYFTLIRFLNSKGLKKDADGVKALSQREVRYIEQGVANVNYTGLWGIRMRFYQLLWELDYRQRDGSKPVGHTIMMKLEFWKNARLIVNENPFAGVGTGDVSDSFKKAYQQNASWLDPQWWMTAHNHYLYTAVALGIPGLLFFLYCFFVPYLRSRKDKYIPLRLFFIIAVISMLTEDTLTTQAGVSFVAFYYCFFLFARPFSGSTSSSSSVGSTD